MWPFRKRNEAERGRKNAKLFLASNPTLEQLNRYFSCAKEDQAFAKNDGGYANAVLEIVKPEWRKRNAI